MSPMRPCHGDNGQCTHPARPGKGLCDYHAREYERLRSRRRRGGLKRGPYVDVVERRDRGEGR
jgi:hypothetical protein